MISPLFFMATAKKTNRPQIGENIPKSIGIIMDGNRRFARARGLPIFKGHEAGYEKLKEFVRFAREAGVRTVIAYAFSTENWNRAKEEVGYLIMLLERAVIKQADEFLKEKVCVRFIGQIECFPKRIRDAIKKIERETSQYKDFTLVLLLSYGGRAEIIEGIKKLVKEKGAKGALEINESEFGKYLMTAGIPDPELVIRTSGEISTSNFLPWQSVYSEWFFTKTLWPAFSRREFLKILKEFASRERRKGK